jgi:hypothetical protein
MQAGQKDRDHVTLGATCDDSAHGFFALPAVKKRKDTAVCVQKGAGWAEPPVSARFVQEHSARVRKFEPRHIRSIKAIPSAADSEAAG